MLWKIAGRVWLALASVQVALALRSSELSWQQVLSLACNSVHTCMYLHACMHACMHE